MTPFSILCIIKCYMYLIVYIMFNECKTRLTSCMASALPLVSNHTNKLTMAEALYVFKVELDKPTNPSPHELLEAHPVIFCFKGCLCGLSLSDAKSFR